MFDHSVHTTVVLDVGHWDIKLLKFLGCDSLFVLQEHLRDMQSGKIAIFKADVAGESILDKKHD